MFIQINNQSGGIQVPICSVKETMAEYTGTKDETAPLAIVGIGEGVQDVDWKGNVEPRNVTIDDVRNSRWLWDNTYSRFVLNPEQDKIETSINVFIDWEPAE